MNKKQRVLELRDKGLTYRDISHIENMPLGSVKSICARKKEPLLISRCIYCGKSITSIKGRRQKKFCNDKCRMAWWNSHRDLISIKKALQVYMQKLWTTIYFSYAKKSQILFASLLFRKSS